jgi:hypothetical protein
VLGLIDAAAEKAGFVPVPAVPPAATAPRPQTAPAPAAPTFDGEDGELSVV